MFRTVKWWVIYDPRIQLIMRQPFRTKREALQIKHNSQTYDDCVVFQVKGTYVKREVTK